MKAFHGKGIQTPGGGVESVEETKEKVAACIHLFFVYVLVEGVPVCVHVCLCVDACILTCACVGGQRSASGVPWEPTILFLDSGSLTGTSGLLIGLGSWPGAAGSSGPCLTGAGITSSFYIGAGN